MAKTRVYQDADDKNVAAMILFKKNSTGRYFYNFDSTLNEYSDPVETDDALRLFAADAIISSEGEGERELNKITSYATFLAGCIDPLAALVVSDDIAPDKDLLGKVVSDLQGEITITDGVISGELKYVDDYTAFSGDPEEQQGYYLALYSEVPDISGVTIKVTTKKMTVTLDEDQILVYRVSEPFMVADLTLIYEVSKEGYETIQKVYSLAGLTFADPE